MISRFMGGLAILALAATAAASAPLREEAPDLPDLLAAQPDPGARHAQQLFGRDRPPHPGPAEDGAAGPEHARRADARRRAQAVRRGAPERRLVQRGAQLCAPRVDGAARPRRAQPGDRRQRRSQGRRLCGPGRLSDPARPGGQGPAALRSDGLGRAGPEGAAHARHRLPQPLPDVQGLPGADQGVVGRPSPPHSAVHPRRGQGPGRADPARLDHPPRRSPPRCSTGSTRRSSTPSAASASSRRTTSAGPIRP